MIIDFVSEIFTMYFRKYIPTFQKEIYILMEWIKNNPISPKLYGIKDLTLYKYQSKQYSDDIDTIIEPSVQVYAINDTPDTAKQFEFKFKIPKGP